MKLLMLLLALALSPNAEASGVVILWTKALDDVSPQAALLYEVRQSTAANIGTLQDAEAYGKIAMPYVVDIDQATITNLNPNTTYYFQVIVKDQAGNKAVYRMTKLVTPKKKGNPKAVQVGR